MSRALGVACPTCGAGRGRQCRTRTRLTKVRLLATPHRARVKLARENPPVQDSDEGSTDD